MALRECPECGNAISTAATACPKCGCPLRGGKKKQSYLGPLLLAFAILIIFAMLYGQEDPDKNRTVRATSPSNGAPRCDATTAKQVVQKALDGGILHRVEGKPEVSRVYTLEPWHHLTIDDKRALDNVVRCTLTNGTSDARTIVVYHDGRTGKELATSNQYGFDMK